ncbi:MAG: XrtA/PEP-CTERM system TPR-repeat protein PrsT [Halofilum sp. (in: g-proteobacteria)]|nr:XrtA/PEP-CTERM system TPR-repeat protein PrsT [Halofilum sp. (in: g-proteobacteria)]
MQYTTETDRPASRARAGIAVTLALALLLAGCGQDVNVEERIAQAEEHRADGDYRAAIIELRNVLKEEPSHARGRAMLGRVYLAVDDLPGAEKELRRAIELGVARDVLVVELGSALLGQGKAERLLENIEAEEDWSAATRAGVHALRARAHLREGNIERARAALESADDADARVLQVHLARVELALAEDDVDAASRRIDRAADAYPGEAAVWRLDARVARARGDTEGAERALTEAIERAANPAEDYLARAQLRAALGDVEGSRQDLEALGDQYADHPRVGFIRAMNAWNEEDVETACTELQQVVSDAPQFVPGRFYLGACHYRRGELNQAESHLNWAHQRQPTPQVARLLGAVQLGLGQFDKARDTVRPVLQNDPDDAAALALLGRIEMGLGNTTEAMQHLQRLAQLRPEDPNVKLQLGAGLLRSGELDAGQEAFGQALALDPDLQQAGMMLVLSHLQERDFELALEKAEEMVEAEPDAALPWNLVALAHAFRQDEQAVREALAEAIEREPADPAARHMLARLERQAGDRESARSHYQAVLNKHPDHTGTLLALAQLEGADARIERVGELLRRAHESDPEALRPRVLLGRYRLARGDAAGALEVVSDADGGVPREGPLLEVAGRAHLAMDQPASALERFEQWAAADPDATGVHLLMARAYSTAGDNERAIEQVEAELARNPDNVEAQILMARARLSQGREGEARDLLAALPDAAADHPSAIETRATLALRSGKLDEAVTLYRRLLEVAPSASNAVRLSEVLRRTGDNAAAVRVLEEWLAENPAHSGVRLVAGDRYLALGREDEAIAAYREVLEHAPRNVQALNNLAWLLRSSKPDEALRLAEKAVELQPTSAPVMDTLGMVLLEQGRAEEALEQFRQGR